MKQGIALFFALIYLVHPINQEAVAYISGLQDVLFVFWGLVSLYLLLIDSKKLKQIIFVNIFLLLSLFSKESGILFFIIILVYIYFFKRNKLLLQILCSFAIGIIYFFIRLSANVPLQKEAGIPIMALPFWERMINVPAIIFYYIQTLIFPKNLTVLNSWVIDKMTAQTFFLPLFYDLIFFSIIFLLPFFLLKKDSKKLLIFFSVWFISGLIIHLHLIPIDTTVTNRFFYFPFIGFLGIVGLSLREIKIKKPLLPLVIVLTIFILTALSLRTFVRNTDWENQSILISHDIKLSKNDYIMEYLYGIELMQSNSNNEALLHTKKAIELFPQSWHAWNSLGIIYSKRGDVEQARAAYLHAISLKKYYGAYENLAMLLLKAENTEEARDFIKDANKLFPNSQKLWYDRIVIENKLKNYDDALYASKRYYLLKKDQKSYTIYQQFLRKQAVNINE